MFAQNKIPASQFWISGFRRLNHASRWIFRHTLEYPSIVLALCSVFVLTAVTLDGTLYRIWNLQRDDERLAARVIQLQKSVEAKQIKLNETNRPEFIEKQARQRLDYVRDGDLVFIFPDEDETSNR